MKKPHPSTIRSTSKQGTGSNQRTSTVTTSTDITTGRVDVNASSPLSIASRRSSSLPSMHQIQSSVSKTRSYISLGTLNLKNLRSVAVNKDSI